eukprot:m.68745 g.68745  ORF g.68745 m.68745 type:complete len:68 (-) comp8534_c0_seq1:217-420(-)
MSDLKAVEATALDHRDGNDPVRRRGLLVLLSTRPSYRSMVSPQRGSGTATVANTTTQRLVQSRDVVR